MVHCDGGLGFGEFDQINKFPSVKKGTFLLTCTVRRCCGANWGWWQRIKDSVVYWSCIRECVRISTRCRLGNPCSASGPPHPARLSKVLTG